MYSIEIVCTNWLSSAHCHPSRIYFKTFLSDREAFIFIMLPIIYIKKIKILYMLTYHVKIELMPVWDEMLREQCAWKSLNIVDSLQIMKLLVEICD